MLWTEQTNFRQGFTVRSQIRSQLSPSCLSRTGQRCIERRGQWKLHTRLRNYSRTYGFQVHDAIARGCFWGFCASSMVRVDMMQLFTLCQLYIEHRHILQMICFCHFQNVFFRYYLTANTCIHDGYSQYDWPAGWRDDVMSAGPCGYVSPDGLGTPEQFWVSVFAIDCGNKWLIFLPKFQHMLIYIISNSFDYRIVPKHESYQTRMYHRQLWALLPAVAVIQLLIQLAIPLLAIQLVIQLVIRQRKKFWYKCQTLQYQYRMCRPLIWQALPSLEQVVMVKPLSGKSIHK